jgi:hypothetical protein
MQSLRPEGGQNLDKAAPKGYIKDLMIWASKTIISFPKVDPSKAQA